MRIFNPRLRVITFRLSSSEYERVSRAAKGSGARSLSDFARGAVLDRTQVPNGRESDQEQLRIISERSEQLLQMLFEVKQRLTASPDNISEAESTT